ncbi:membrane transport protein-domain-containing protein [Infundibulicybe gibba]|nr:membrane transport protein-domain-containing protein [Infundibulicybe gibba]
MESSSIDMPVGALLKTVFTSILEVFLLCLAGYILAGWGILDKKTQKQINRLNVSLFTPALLFSKVAFFLTPAKLRELWIIPLFFILVTGVSMAVAFSLGWIFRLKRSQRSFAMAAAMFMNSNSLPIALMQSLVVTVPGLKWGKDDNKNAMVGRALTYLVLYSTLGMVLRWSYGVRLLSQADSEPEAPPPDSESSPLLASFEGQEYYIGQQPSFSTLVGPDDVSPTISAAIPDPTRLRPSPRRQTTFYNSFPNSPTQSRTDLPSIESVPGSSDASTFVSPAPSDSESDTEPSAAPATGTLPTHTTPVPVRRRSTAPPAPPAGFKAFLRRTRRRISRCWVGLNDFMTVPLWAALASLLPIKGALSSAGNCSIPLTLIVLGAYFYPAPKEVVEGSGKAATTTAMSSLIRSVRKMFKGTKDQRRRPKPLKTGETKTVIIAVASRMIITPMLLMPLMALSAKFDVQKVFDESPRVCCCKCVADIVASRVTLAQITQAASGDAFERLISRTIFWSYCILTPPATILYVVIGLVLAKL